MLKVFRHGKNMFFKEPETKNIVCVTHEMLDDGLTHIFYFTKDSRDGQYLRYDSEANEVEELLCKRYLQLKGKLSKVGFELNTDVSGYSLYPSDKELTDGSVCIQSAYQVEDTYVYNFTYTKIASVFSLVVSDVCHTFMKGMPQNFGEEKRRIWRTSDKEFRDFCFKLGQELPNIKYVYEMV